MNIAILSDIHANFEALQAVLKQVDQLDFDHIYVLGDLVGYYYEPHKCLEALEARSVTAIKGNHEELLFRSINCKTTKQQLREKYGSGLVVAEKVLDRTKIRNLLNLPRRINVNLEGKNIVFMHEANFSTNPYLYPDFKEYEINKDALTDAHAIFFGHSHYQFSRMINNTRIINPGSVGQSRERLGYASWASYNSCTDTIRLFRTKYDYHKVYKAAEEIDPHIKYLRDVLIRGNREHDLA